MKIKGSINADEVMKDIAFNKHLGSLYRARKEYEERLKKESVENGKDSN